MQEQMSSEDRMFWVLASLKLRADEPELTSTVREIVAGQTDLSTTLDLLEVRLGDSGLDALSRGQIEKILKSSNRLE